MSGAELALLLVGWMLAAASPGPATLALAGTAMARGRGPALWIAAGISCGSALWGLAGVLGLGAVMLRHGWLLEALRYAGAVYILWLAFKSARSAMRPAAALAPDIARGGARRVWLSGLLLHLTNPKAIFAWGAVFVVAAPADATTVDLLGLWARLICASSIVFFGYAVLFSLGGAMRVYGRARRWIEGAFAALFGGAALAILSVRPA